MADYDKVAGLKIPVLSADPSNPVEGELWYNSTAEKFRGYGLYQVSAAWTTSPATLNAGRRGCPGAGTTDDGIGFLGYIGGYPRYGASETYNGSTWTNQPALPTPLGSDTTHVGAGSPSAAGIGGYYYSGPSGAVGSRHSVWNGSSWSSATSLPASRYGMGGCGTVGDFMVGGGAFANGGYFPQTTAWSWNGSSFTSEPAVNWSPGTAATYASWGSSSTDWYASAPGSTNAFYSYNGTSWSTAPTTFPTTTSGRSTWGNSAAGTAIVTTSTETWNGSTWSLSPATSNTNNNEPLRSNSTTSGTDGWVFGGGPGNGINSGETFVGPVNAVEKVNLDFS